MTNDMKGGSCGCGSSHKEQAPAKTRGAQEDYPAKTSPGTQSDTKSFTKDKQSTAR